MVQPLSLNPLTLATLYFFDFIILMLKVKGANWLLSTLQG